MPVFVALAIGLLLEILFFGLLLLSAIVFTVAVLAVRKKAPLLPAWTPGTPFPTLLLHGYSQNAGNWFIFRGLLRKEGVNQVSHLTLSPMFASIEHHALRLSKQVDEMCAQSGAPRVNIIAHSMGGLVSRWYIQELGGAPKVAMLVTLGTPHHGTLSAYIGIGANAREMRPGSALLTTLAAGCDRLAETRVISYWSNLDQLIIPSRSGCMGAPAEDRAFPFCGHSTFLFSKRLARDVASLVTGGAGNEIADGNLQMAD
jgi:triacylglycerol lipase